jgi:hypothetical protein
MGRARIAIVDGRSRSDVRTGIGTPGSRRSGPVLVVICAMAFFCAASAVAGERVVADLDGDGVRDHVSLSRRDPTLVRVWLSSTRQIDVIRSREPILHIAAADLDGDARKELVARGPASLRVWSRRSGHFQKYRPRHRPIARRISRARNHASNADPLCAELSATEYSAIAPSLDSILLAVPPLRRGWTDTANPVRGPTSSAPVHPFTPRPPPFS